MRKKKIMIVFGTRPEAIKMAPLIHLLKKDKRFSLSVCVTAQHREMLDQVMKTFEIKPNIDLNIMTQNQDLSDITSTILLKLRPIFKKFAPDIILVHGDTSTTLATALAGFYSKIKVGHVEAGLRTYNLQSPYPEEFNRQIVAKISNFHFAPTKLNQLNLIKEGLQKSSIYVTGNTVIDSLNWILEKINKDKNLYKFLTVKINNLLNFDWTNHKYILITCHRRENFGNGIKNVCDAIEKLAKKYHDINFVFPVHLNPKILNIVNKKLDKRKNVYLIKPQRYEIFVNLLKFSYLVLTDSGGLQEEAPHLGKPVLVVRESTERPEGIKSGTVKLVKVNKNKIIEETSRLIEDKNYYKKMSNLINPYGDGKASYRIIKFLSKI